MRRGIILWLVLVLIPLFSAIHLLFPYSDTFVFLNREYTLEYFSDWQTYIWQAMVHAIGLIVAVGLVLTLDKFTDWKIIAILMELFFMSGWYFWRLIDADNIMKDDYKSAIIVSLLIAGALIIWFRSRRKPTYKERYLKLIQARDRANEEFQQKLRELEKELGTSLTQRSTDS